MKLELAGAVFGRLLVLHKVEGSAGMWLCRCECGKEKAVKGFSLTHGDTSSCGCWRAMYGMLLPPTKKQMAVLNFIRSHIADKGYPPVVHEIAQHFGFASDNAAQCHINQLRRKGIVTTGRGLVRTLAITEKGMSL